MFTNTRAWRTSRVRTSNQLAHREDPVNPLQYIQDLPGRPWVVSMQIQVIICTSKYFPLHPGVKLISQHLSRTGLSISSGSLYKIPQNQYMSTELHSIPLRWSIIVFMN